MRKIDLMHHLFGEDKENLCITCPHLLKRQYSRTYYKCECYGMGSSEGSDWRVSYIACGLYGKEYKGKPVICMATRQKPPESAIKGQISLFDKV